MFLNCLDPGKTAHVSTEALQIAAEREKRLLDVVKTAWAVVTAFKSASAKASDQLVAVNALEKALKDAGQ